MCDIEAADILYPLFDEKEVTLYALRGAGWRAHGSWKIPLPAYLTTVTDPILYVVPVKSGRK